MKRLVTALAVTYMLFSNLPCFADGMKVVVEGEAYKSSSFKVTTEKGSEFSNGEFVSFLALPNQSNAYKMVYTFDIMKEGTYALDFRCNDLNKAWTTDFSFSINDGELTDINSVAEKKADFTNSKYPSLIKEYSAGSYELSRGENTLTIVLKKEDTRATLDGKIGFWLDYFSFSEMKFGFDELVPEQDCGVFERGRSIRYDIKFFAKADKDYKYDYKVTDFWGRTADTGVLELAQGKKQMYANFGVYELGWYKIELYEQGADELLSYATFAVVPKMSERYQGETPFAIDFASSQLVKKSKDIDKLSKAARLAGIEWVRERSGWTTFGINNYDYNVITQNLKRLKKHGFKTTTIFTASTIWDDYTDLFRIYNFQKDLVKNADDCLDVIEVENELDGATSKVPADMYSAYLKAMYIGNADAGGNMGMSMVSLCMETDTAFNDGIFKNGVTEFTDFYNFHAHTTYAEKNKILGIRKDFLNRHNEIKMSTVKQDIPNWITEAGIYLDLGNNAELTSEQGRIQARYLTTSTVESLSMGIDKHFWFVWPKFVEHNKELGTFDAKLNPNPAYQAEAICSYMLGKSEYKGGIENNNMQGHVFNNGKNDVFVLWTDVPQKYSIVTDKAITVADIMGQSKVVEPVDGRAEVEIAYYPVYVIFDGAADTANYYPREYGIDKTVKREFNSAERIILQQSFNQELGTARNNGYELPAGENTQLLLTVNNFNSDSKNVKITGQLDGYNVIPETDTVVVPAMSKVDIKVTLEPQGEPKFNGIDDIKMYLKFTAETDGNISSPSVALVRIVNDVILEPAFMMDGYDTPESYDIKNVGGGADTASELQPDGSIRFDVQFYNSARWYYPKLQVQDISKLTQSDGIVYWVKADEDCTGMGDHKVFVNFSDGRRYFTGNEQKYLCSPEWVQVKIPWEDFMLFSSPYGAVDLRTFDPALIESIELGGNFQQNDISFYIKEAGFFVSEKEDIVTEIVFEGVEDGGRYKTGELTKVSVILPENCSPDVSVMLTDSYMDKFVTDGRTVTVDLSQLTKGKHTLRINTKDDFGFVVSDSIDFYIE